MQTLTKLPAGFSPEERGNRACGYFKEGYNCCQSVVMAFADIAGLDTDTLSALSSGFGGGMGRMREVCGAFSGMVMMAGVIFPSCNPANMEERKGNYALVQEFAAAFRRDNGGSIICRDLLGTAPNVHESPAPAPRTDEYLKKRPCFEIVRNAALIVARKLQEMNGCLTGQA